MHPYFHLFGYEVSSYGFFIVLGFAVGICVCLLRAKRWGMEREDVLYISLLAAVGVLLGGKLLYLVTALPALLSHYREWLENPGAFLQLLRGGYVFYGGLLGAALMIVWYAKRYKLGRLSTFDFLIPAVPIVHAFGRIGCFCVGCCYGVQSNLPFAVELNESSVAPHHQTLLPIQLIEAGFLFVLSGVLILLSGKMKRAGQLTAVYLILYGFGRFVLEFFRGDLYRGVLLGLSTSQWISLFLLLAGILLLVRKQKTTGENKKNN